MLIDSHTHLDSFHRGGRLPEILTRAADAGVGQLITVGTAQDDWSVYRDLATAHPGRIAYTAGLHPCSVEADWEAQFATLPNFWTGPQRPVALGEIGLDRFHLPQDSGEAEVVFARQRAAFHAGLALARDLDCPVVVHSRGAFEECVATIDASGVDWAKVVFHCFVEGPAEMTQLVERGGRGSFTGILTYKSAENVRQAARVQGLATCMVETDAPYLTPVPHRGKPNEPAYLRHTADFAAGLFGLDPTEFAAITTANARSFFGLPSTVG